MFKYVCLVGLACCYGWMEVFIFSAVIWPLIVRVYVCVFDCLASWPVSRITSLAARSSAAAACEPATRLANQRFYTSPCPMDPRSPSPNLSPHVLCAVAGDVIWVVRLLIVIILNSHCVPDISSLLRP